MVKNNPAWFFYHNFQQYINKILVLMTEILEGKDDLDQDRDTTGSKCEHVNFTNFIQPISYHWSFSITLENIRKPLVF